MQPPKHTRRSSRDDPAQLVFRFADDLRQENEMLRTENEAMREKLMEIKRIMRLYAGEIAALVRSHRPPTSPAA